MIKEKDKKRKKKIEKKTKFKKTYLSLDFLRGLISENSAFAAANLESVVSKNPM